MIHCNRIGKHIIDQFYLDEDVNVPDTKEDVMHIIQGEGYLKIEVRMINEVICEKRKVHRSYENPACLQRGPSFERLRDED